MKTLRPAAICFTVICILSFNLAFFASAPTPASASDAPQPGAVSSTTLRVMSDAIVAPVLLDLVDDLWSTYEVVLTVEVVSNTYDAFVTAVEAGNGPDLAFVPHDRVGSLVRDALIAPLDLGAEASQYQATAIDACTRNGSLYCLPWSVESLAFFYNTTLVPVPPTTWTQVESMGKALQTSGDVQFGMSLAGATYDVYPLMTAFGGYVFGVDTNGDWDPHDLGIDSPGMIAAVDWLDDRVDDGFLSSSTDWEYAHQLFETGQSPFIMAGPWALDRLRASGVPYAISDFPSHTYPGAPFLGVKGIIMNAASPNLAMAETFLLEFIGTRETMTALANVTSRPPAYIPSIADITDPDMLKFSAIAATGSPIPHIPEMGFVWAPWDNAVRSVMEGTITAEAALTAAALEIEQTMLLDGMVNVPGSYQALLGCDYDWQPSCLLTAMRKFSTTHWISGPFNLPAGNYECKVALDGGWAINYGVDGVLDGANIPFAVGDHSTVHFLWDETTKILAIYSFPVHLYLPILER